MQRNSRSRTTFAATSALLLVLAALALAACGGSSTSSSTTTSASVAKVPGATATTPKIPRGQVGSALQSRFKAVRECLQKNGITLPQRKPGQPGAGPFGAAGLPKGVTRAQYEAALKKCGGRAGGGAFFNRGGRFNSPQVKQALSKFAACLREHGVNVPAPNTSGKGPIFDTKGIDTSSSTFQAAEAKCRADLQGAFRASPQGTPPSGAPPAG